jgi:uroporphyrinogen-III decarboxylase
LLDVQGPFDNASIIWGSDIFLAIYDEPDKVRSLMALVTDTIAAVIREHRRIDGCPLDEQDGALNFLGGACIRDDSSINLSGPQYDEFCKPCDAELLGEFGGWIHFCGRAHQWWPRMLDMRGLKGINPYQGEFYDLYDLFARCEPAGVAVVQWTTPLDARCRERVRTGFSRCVWAHDWEDALRAKERLYRTGHADCD